MLKQHIHIFLFLISYNLLAQINLVQNPSFELYDTCPYKNGQVHFAKPWFQPNQYNINTTKSSSSEYYNLCDTTYYYSVPFNGRGYAYANSGIAYSGIILYYDQSNYREYIEGVLDTILKAGKKYKIEFYVLLSENSMYAINSIGAYLSADSILYKSSFYVPLIAYVPQVVNTSNNISDTLNWTKRSGEFIAGGGEKFITIGNFKTNANTQYSTVFGGIGFSYYYIDDVSVTEVIDTTATPNPPEGFLIPTILTGETFFEIKSLPPFSKLYLYNTLGQLIYKNENYENNFNTINTSTGIYYYNLQLANGNFYKGKLCVVK